MNYYLELFLTRYCNQDCYYCSIFKTGKQTECDISKIKYVLDHVPNNTVITMSGGEIGLITNIDEAFKTIHNHKNVKGVIALSNGLIRKRGVDWLDKVEYVEHPIKDIVGRDIIKFYPDLPYVYNNVNVIVATEKTVKSLLDHWDYFKDTEFVTDKFYIKIMAFKTHSIISYLNDIERLFTLLKTPQLRMVESARHLDSNQSQKILCMLNPPYPFIDLDNDLIGHCASSHGRCKRVPLTVENLNLLPQGLLFNDCDYCQSCYTYDDGISKSKAKLLLKSRHGEFQNRSYR